MATLRTNNPGDGGAATFWEHLDVLRGCLIRICAITAAAALVAFAMKDTLFAIVLAPRTSDFVTFRLLGGEPFAVRLMNVDLTEQFMMHMKTACYAGLLVASPYIIYALFRFVSPALYDSERRHAGAVVGSGYLMFIAGTLLNYFLVFPLTVRFLGTYQVSGDVENMLTVRSYIDTMITMNLLMGLVFELPVACWLMARLGLLTARMMQDYRRHAIVAILVVAAIITPTTDVFTLFVVSLPIWLLYEASIIIVKLTRKAKTAKPEKDKTEAEPAKTVAEETANKPNRDGQTAQTASPNSPNGEAEQPKRQPETAQTAAPDAPASPTAEIQDFGWEDQRLRDWGMDSRK